MPSDSDWQILAEETTQEKDPKKLMEIINALTAALDERQGRKRHAPLSSDGITPAGQGSENDPDLPA
jgi:hypothetical protein